MCAFCAAAGQTLDPPPPPPHGGLLPGPRRQVVFPPRVTPPPPSSSSAALPPPPPPKTLGEVLKISQKRMERWKITPSRAGGGSGPPARPQHLGQPALLRSVVPAGSAQVAPPAQHGGSAGIPVPSQAGPPDPRNLRPYALQWTRILRTPQHPCVGLRGSSRREVTPTASFSPAGNTFPRDGGDFLGGKRPPGGCA